VEHPCQNCGSPVDNTSPFCPSCGASQIRFLRPDSAPHAVKVERVTLHAPQTRGLDLETSVGLPPEVASADGPHALPSAIRAGAIAAVLSAVPFAFILALPLGGFLAVLLYRRRNWGRQPTPAAGFRLGALTGAIGFAIYVVVAAFATLISHASRDDLKQKMLESIRAAELRNPDPQVSPMFEYLKHHLALMMISGLLFMCVIFVLLAGVGGALEASLKRRNPPHG
jgi:hypothetical protein